MQNGVVMAGQPFGVSLEEKLLPQYLKEIDYATHMIGKVSVILTVLSRPMVST